MRAALKEEMAKMNFAMPVMPLLAEHLKRDGKLQGKVIGWHCHLTEITALAADALLEAGAKLFLSECNPDTSNADSIEYMRAAGAAVYTGEDSPAKVLAHQPRVLSDTGFVLTRAYLNSVKNAKDGFVFGGNEITTSGITAARELAAGCQIPVLDINTGEIKTNIENYHGVADGVMDLLAQLTGKVWTGHQVCVVGYGNVGKGVAAYLRRAGAAVTIVERDPVRNLIAHYDGYPLDTLANALAQASLVITATGHEGIISKSEWLGARDGALFVNVGHWATELDTESLHAEAEASSAFAPFITEYRLKGGKRIYVVAEGGPANVVTLSGSPEPCLIHLTTEILCMNYLLDMDSKGVALSPGVQTLPAFIERAAAELALRALNLSNNDCK
jgi:adenosylhomocysteinase